MMSMRSSQGLSHQKSRPSTSANPQSETYQPQTQAQEMRDLFAMLDKDGDGVVTESDLRAMLNSLGQDTSSASLRNMLSMVPSPLEFPAFLTYITSLKSQISSRHELIGALTSFDETDSGYIDFEDIKLELMRTGAKRMTEDQVNAALQGFVERTGKNKGKVSYARFLDSMMGDQTVS